MILNTIAQMQAQYYVPFKVQILMRFPLQPFLSYNIDKNQKYALKNLTMII